MESELVGGFFTEHSSVPFVFFFLSEYSSIVLFSALTAILFLGGYNVLHFNIYILIKLLVDISDYRDTIKYANKIKVHFHIINLLPDYTIHLFK